MSTSPKGKGLLHDEDGDRVSDPPTSHAIPTFAGKLDLTAFANKPQTPETQDDKGLLVAIKADGDAVPATESVYFSPATRAVKRKLAEGPSNVDDAVAVTAAVAASQSAVEASPSKARRRSAKASPSSPSSAPASAAGSTPRSRRSRSRRVTVTTASVTTEQAQATTVPPANPTVSNFRDTVYPDMILLFVGVNPGIKTGLTGHSYAHPSNLYWKFLHESGITCQRHPPRDTYVLPELYNIGNTNLVVRPTRDASALSRAEMEDGARLVQEKIAQARPEAVCFVGKGVWEAVWRVNHNGKSITKEQFKYGWQDESENIGVAEGWDGSRVFVATTTSGLAAGMSPAEKLAVWMQLGQWVKARRRDRKPLGTAGSAPLVE